MSTFLYQASVPAIVHHFKSLSTILDIVAKHAEEKNIDPAVFIGSRLAPDMLPFGRQIQLMSDGIKGFAARVTGTEIPKFEDTETTFAELKERIEKTVAFIESIEEAKYEGADVKSITFSSGKRERSFNSGLEYLTQFALPNFYFHSTTAYDILRHNGVALGKLDFLGGRQN